MTNRHAETETNRTGIEFVDGLVNLLELNGAIHGPVEHDYSGGGASLFQTPWLRHFVSRTTCYDPFYWEDAEWGVRAKSAGLKNVFVPESTVKHAGKSTVNSFYPLRKCLASLKETACSFNSDAFPGAIRPPSAKDWRTPRAKPFANFSIPSESPP